jgi:hypothetical protein
MDITSLMLLHCMYHICDWLAQADRAVFSENLNHFLLRVLMLMLLAATDKGILDQARGDSE